MSAVADAVVVGGGIVGAACADALARAGLRITIVEPGPIGGGATAAGMGHVVAMDGSPAELALTRWSRDLWHELAPELPDQAEFASTGTLWVAADEEEMGEVRRKAASYGAVGVRSVILDAAALAGEEPNLRPGLAGGLLVPDDVVLCPPTVAGWLVARAAARVETRAAAAVARDGVTLADGSRIAAGAVVCACGTWSRRLLPGLNVTPRKGHLAITDRVPGFVRHQLVELGYLKSAHGNAAESVAFNVQPRRSGQVLIGSSRQSGVESTDIDRPVLAHMLDRAVEYMPALAGLPVIRTWTGFRASAPDKLPLIGPLDGVWVATGHEGLGIATALGTGRLIAAMVTGAPTPIDAAPFAPARASANAYPAPAEEDA